MSALWGKITDLNETQKQSDGRTEFQKLNRRVKLDEMVCAEQIIYGKLWVPCIVMLSG